MRVNASARASWTGVRLPSIVASDGTEAIWVCFVALSFTFFIHTLFLIEKSDLRVVGLQLSQITLVKMAGEEQ